MKTTRWVAVVSAVALATIAAACSQSTPTSQGTPAASMTGTPHEDELTFGEPAQQGEEDRVIEVTQLDEMRFEPSSIRVKQGETIRFEITNAGQAPHEFVLGDADFQAAHEVEMAGMSGAPMMNEPNAIAVEPGETGTLVWTFTDGGTIEYACHVLGHYPAGMAGDLTVD